MSCSTPMVPKSTGSHCFPGSAVTQSPAQLSQRAFQMQARQFANALLLGEEAAVLARIRDIVDKEIVWLIPAGRRISLVVDGGEVELAFVKDTVSAAFD